MTTNTRLEQMRDGYRYYDGITGNDIRYLLSLVSDLEAKGKEWADLALYHANECQKAQRQLADVKVDNQNEVQALADALNDSIENEREGRTECERLSVRIANLENGNEDLDKILDRYNDALELIKDGGVAQGVLANAEERMLAMCSIATDALKGEKS